MHAYRDNPNSCIPAEAQHFSLLFAVQQAILALHANELGPAILLGNELHASELRRPHTRSANIADLTAAHQIVQCEHSLFQRHSAVEAVNLEHVDVVGPETI